MGEGEVCAKFDSGSLFGMKRRRLGFLAAYAARDLIVTYLVLSFNIKKYKNYLSVRLNCSNIEISRIFPIT